MVSRDTSPSVITGLIICLSSAVLIGSWALGKLSLPFYRGEVKRVKPRKWVKVGTVKKLMIYPIKSCQGISVDKAILTGLGLKCENHNIRDRDFLLVDGNGKQLNMVNYPKMALIQTQVKSGDELTLSAPNMPDFTFSPPKPDANNKRTCKIKTDTAIKVLDCGDEVASWFQKYLENEHLRLCYYYLNKTQRSLEAYQLQCPQYGKSDFGSFHNASAYMMIAEESVHELNKYLPEDKQCTWKNFRPTILIDGLIEPWSEINWSYVKIGMRNGADGGSKEEGNTILNVAAPCHRCPVTTVDQQNGVMTGDGEPLKTLRSLNINEQVVDDSVRKMLRNRGVMGLRLGLYDDKEHSSGTPPREGALIYVGDPVYAALL